MADERLVFRPSARIQRFLGRELIADPNVAIIEFVKNSYDAGASRVAVEFRLARDPPTLTLADDGVGMTAAEFRESWMRPGFSEKADEWRGRRDRREGPAGARQASRVPTGEKGIGRLAAGRLGERLDVWTRRFDRRPWLHVHFDWSAFETMETPLDEVEIPHDFETPPPQALFGVTTGTILVVSDLHQRWDEGIRGRPVRGRSRTRLGRLRQDLEFLIRPLGRTDFRIELDSDKVRNPDDIGTVSPRSALRNAHYSYSFELQIDAETDKPVITRTVARSEEAARLGDKPREEELGSFVVDDRLANEEGRPETLEAGGFVGTFIYTPPPATRRAREVDESPVGVLLYRDGVLVEPYGLEDNDWVGARARKAQRQGHAAIQPDTLSGHVLISRKGNPELRDQTNRLGLLETSASENFIAHVRAEFSRFEDLIYREVLEPRWEGSREKEAMEKAREGQERASILLRSLAHSLRQPLTGLEWELEALKGLEERRDLPSEVKPLLHGVRTSLEDHVERAQALIRKFLDARPPEIERVLTKELVESAVDQVRALAESAGASIDVAGFGDSKPLVAPDLVKQGIAALLSNAIEAPRGSGTTPVVTVSAESKNGDVLLTVSDNGSGIPGGSNNKPLASIESTKGRPAAGLFNAEEAIRAARGRLRLLATSAEGTTFEVRLPTRVDGLAGS